MLRVCRNGTSSSGRWGEAVQPGGFFNSPAVSGASHVMAFNERDLTSDAPRAGHGLGRPGPRPGLTAHPSVTTMRSGQVPNSKRE